MQDLLELLIRLICVFNHSGTFYLKMRGFKVFEQLIRAISVLIVLPVERCRFPSWHVVNADRDSLNSCKNFGRLKTMAVMRIVDLRSFIIAFKQMWDRELKSTERA